MIAEERDAADGNEMRWWRSGWARGVALWTVALLAVAVLVALDALVSLHDAQQACFFGFPAVPCPAGDDPRVARFTFAFFGIPLIWILGIGLAALGRALVRHSDRRR